METITVKVSDAEGGQRLDKVLAAAAGGLSRARVQALIAAGHVRGAGGPVTDSSRKTKAGEVFEIAVPPAQEAALVAQDIPLDIVYEDGDLIVINKPADLVVHPAAGNHDGTLVNALLAHCGAALSGIGGVKRPGIVHRLDKETSGLMVVAKNDAAHHGLSAQLATRRLTRVYQAIVWGVPSPAQGRIETQIGRHKTNRKKMAVLDGGGKDAVTDYRVLETFGLWASLVECRLKTGRTHQIRVHMAHIGHPLAGDPLYGKASPAKCVRQMKIPPAAAEALAGFRRQALHAAQLEFIHPIGENRISLRADLPADMRNLLQVVRHARG
jgi:23S rRNA pseudouridine1911/1915/1917 synthase